MPKDRLNPSIMDVAITFFQAVLLCVALALLAHLIIAFTKWSIPMYLMDWNSAGWEITRMLGGGLSILFTVMYHFIEDTAETSK